MSNTTLKPKNSYRLFVTNNILKGDLFTKVEAEKPPDLPIDNILKRLSNNVSTNE